VAGRVHARYGKTGDPGQCSGHVNMTRLGNVRVTTGQPCVA